MKRGTNLVLCLLGALTLLSALALAAKPKPNESLSDRTAHYSIGLFVSSNAKKVQAGIETAPPACSALHARSAEVKIKKGGEFTAHTVDAYADWTVKGRFVSKTKAKGTVVATVSGSACPKDEFVAKEGG
jgi:hypothetical protein